VKRVFPLISDEKLAALRSADPAIAAINSKVSPVSFAWMRETFKKDYSIKDQLQYGKAILSNPNHLNQYLYTYGLMIKSQWETVLKSFEATGEPLRIVDYGAGQGLAGIMLAETFGPKFSESVQKVTIIEPSLSAIVRCHAVYKNLFPNSNILCLNVMLDEVDAEYFSSSEARTIHIFSNILDIPSFNQEALFDKSMTNGNHVIAAVSHDRDFDGGSVRIRKIEESVRNHAHSGWLEVHSSTISQFSCGTHGKFDAISWVANLTVDR
jgi:hypothetical protein